MVDISLEAWDISSGGRWDKIRDHTSGCKRVYGGSFCIVVDCIVIVIGVSLWRTKEMTTWYVCCCCEAKEKSDRFLIIIVEMVENYYHV